MEDGEDVHGAVGGMLASERHPNKSSEINRTSHANPTGRKQAEVWKLEHFGTYDSRYVDG